MGRYLGWLGRRVLAASRVTWLAVLAVVAVLALLATGVLTPSSSPPTHVASSPPSSTPGSSTTVVATTRPAVATTRPPAPPRPAPPKPPVKASAPEKHATRAKRGSHSHPTARKTVPVAPPTTSGATPSRPGLLPPALAGATLSSVATIGSADVWVAGQPGSAGVWGMLHYNGSDWTPASVPGSPVALNSVFAVSPSDVWAVGRGATVLRCTSPASCTRFILGSGATDLESIWGYSPETGVDYLWAVGQGGAIYALTWSHAGLSAAAQGSSSLSRTGLNGVWGMVVTSGATTSVYVWAVGDQQAAGRFNIVFGTAAYPTDAPGNTLFWQETGPTCSCAADLSSVSGAAAPSGLEALWAVGPANPYGWTILNFQGRSGRWTAIPGPSGAGQDLEAVTTVDAGQAWAAGAGGTILQFYRTWSRQPTPSSKAGLLGIDGVGAGARQIWAVGQSGTVWAYRPSSSGATWAAAG